VVRDSAGVRIAESHASAWAAVGGWKIATDPLLEFDGSEGGSPGRLGDVVGAVRLRDGRIAVADASANEVRYHAPDGAFLFATGGAPGGDEAAVSALGSLTRFEGDSLLLFDPAGRRLIVLSPEGTVASSATLMGANDLPLDRAAAFSDGTVVVRTGWRASLMPPGDGVSRAPVWFLRFSTRGVLMDTVAVEPGSAVGSVSLGAAHSFVTPLLGPLTPHVVHGQRLYVGTGERYELRAYGADGGLETSVRRPGVDLSVVPAELSAARAERLGMARGNPVAEQLLARIDNALPAPASRPAYAELIVDALGNLWVSEYPPGGPGGARGRTPRVWTVFDPAGRMLGDVGVPPGLALLEVGAVYVLGVRRDPEGARSVLLHGLAR
jgi:hypothetical protein